MKSSPLMRVESVVVVALRQAAADYTASRGHFLPFAENRIHEALQDYDKACRHSKKGGHWSPGRHPHPEAIDPAAFRRGCMMAGCL